MFKVFYSWQSDLPRETNHKFILKALENACKELRSQNGVIVEPTVDRDTQNVAGAVNIAEIILLKIMDADVFVADVSLINLDPINSSAKEQDLNIRKTPNPNVLFELGYAIKHLGNEGVILVLNEFYGNVEQLPFDLRGLRTIRYTENPDKLTENGKNKLKDALKTAIKYIASVTRSDPILAMIYPKTQNVIGQAEGMLQAMIQETRKQLDPKLITKDELEIVCSSIHPYEQAPLTINLNPITYANWIQYLQYWRVRSQNFTSEILIFSNFLSREHVALLAAIEQCYYFKMLSQIANSSVPITNKNLEILANPMWKYIEAIKNLREYAEKTLARRTLHF
jgi:Predicted nucleotide-binding protein containing TIR-like domain